MDFYMINDKDLVMSANRNDFTMFLWGYLNGHFEKHFTCKIQKMGELHFFLISNYGCKYSVSRFVDAPEGAPIPLPIDPKTGLEIKDVLEIVAGVRPKATRTGDDVIKQAAIILRDHCKNKGVFCSGCPFEINDDQGMGTGCCKLIECSPERWEV